MSGSSYTNERFAVYLGGISQSIMQNNPMPEVGVALGSHRGTHRVWLMECGRKVEFGGTEEEGSPDNINELLNQYPKEIFSYYGFAASPHRLTFMDNGLVLIPTDIGLLQYDYIEDEVQGEWVNPVLLPFVSDLVNADEDSPSCSVGGVSWTEVQTPDGPMIIPVPQISADTSPDTQPASSIPYVLAEDVYLRTAHMGSYGQVAYESGDFTADMIVRLVR